MNYIFIILCIKIIFLYAFKINSFDPIIGNWALLYTSNKNYVNNKLSLKIIPIITELNKVNVKIKECETNNILTFTKIINCNLENTNYDDIDNDEICSLIILKKERYIKSISIFEFPYFSIKYNSPINKKYTIIWKINYRLSRLYIYIEGDTYIFEKKYYDKIDINNDRITTNFFLITNFISFILGKIFEKTIHIN